MEMGNRANVFMKDWSGGGTFFYTHWHADELPAMVQRALARHERWTDHSYLARIVFCEMVKDNIDGETGFGISASVGDGDWRVIQVDPNTQRVTFGSANGQAFTPSGPTWTFDEYVQLSNFSSWSELTYRR
jgi:hypothetical protein